MKKIETVSGKVSRFLAGVPRKHIVRAGRLMGSLAYFLDRRHQRIVERNLKFTHPEWSEDYIRQLSLRVFQNMGITILEICQISGFSREDILGNVRIRGKENLSDALKSPKGLILISAHLGNWEMGSIVFSAYLQKPMLSIARKIQYKRLDRWMHRLRSRFGNTIIDKKGALGKMVRTLSKGGILAILIDQGTKLSEGVEVTFFGKTTTMTPAPAMLARRYECSVLPAFCIREPDAGLTIIFEPPLTLKKTSDLHADIRENTQQMACTIEKAVRSHVEQWLWFHKRWKRHYPSLYAEDIAKRQRRREKRKAKVKNPKFRALTTSCESVKNWIEAVSKPSTGF
jgi:KDO2-lipid IV(A) lauroyltransferase